VGFAKAGAVVAILILSGIGILAHFASGRKPEQNRKPDPAPVIVTTVQQRDIPVQLHAMGKVEPLARVTLKARINGELTHVHFKEGQEVKTGELLLTIDPRPFEVALREAEARMARDAALADKAEKDLQRYQSLMKGNYISKEQFEQVRANSEAMRATLQADKALVESAKLQLSYCEIRAPISGRIGRLQIDQGSMIKANDDKGVVDIVQIVPIYVDFSVPEKHLPDILKYMALHPLQVDAVLPNVDALQERGELTFLDNEVDRQTGTIRLRAVYENREKRLWPGQFVKAVLTLRVEPDALVIPYQAIQKGQIGEFVYVIREDQTAELRPVTVKMTFLQNAVIDKGLNPGEHVVIDGQIRLSEGSKVSVKGNAGGEGKKES
jgi:multidrug efflux system membrane fusion protein